MLRVFALLAAAGLVALTACSGSKDGASGAAVGSAATLAPEDGSDVVAEVNGEAITRVELEEKAAAPLARLR